YSYKWAEVLSADAFSAFEDAGLDDPTAVSATGRRFRDTVLALGGSRHPMEVFKAFRGREPTTAALLRQSGLAKAAWRRPPAAAGVSRSARRRPRCPHRNAIPRTGPSGASGEQAARAVEGQVLHGQQS